MRVVVKLMCIIKFIILSSLWEETQMKLNKLGKLFALIMLTALLTAALAITAGASVSTTDDIFDLTETSVHDGSCGTVTVAWNAVSGADYYIVYLDGVHRAYTFNTSYTFTNFTVGEAHEVKIVARVGNAVANSGEMTISAEHVYTTEVTEPDCINGGYTTYTCDCGYTFVGDNVDALGHDFTAATCVTQKTCKVCGHKEGMLNADNHESNPEWTNLSKPNSAHQSVYPCCGAVHVSTESHEWENGVCTECGWACIHEGGTATCTDKAVCTNCGSSYGVKNPNNHTSDNDVWTATATTHSSVYECCNAPKVSVSNHDWNGGACSVCSYACLHGTTHWTTTESEHTKICSICDEVLLTENHNWNGGVCSDCEYVCAHDSTDDGDCTTAVYCAICGKETTPAGVHTPEADDDDCTTAIHCSVCGKETTPAKNHTPEADDGDCTTAIHCSVCGKETTPAKNHTPEADDGDCTTAINCSVCGKEAIPAKNHTPAADDGDCTTAILCSVCSKETTPAKNHTPEADDNDCTTAVHCSVCGKVTTPAKSHTPEADDGDCTTAIHCSVCGKETTPAKNHTPAADDGDCTTAINCSVCGKEAIPAKNHTPEADDNNCATAVHCSVCGKETTPAKSHTPEADDGDCTTAIHCSVCGVETTPANAEHFGGSATCLTQAVCEACGTAYGSLDPTVHTGSVKWTTTNTTHSAKFTCCDAIVTIATNHHWVDGECDVCAYRCNHTNKNWSNDDSTHTWTCSVCEKSVTSDHDFDSKVTAPSCTKGGYTTHSCLCGEKYTDSETPATGHDWSDGNALCKTCQTKCNHPTEKLVEGKDATCTEEGYTDYHHCDTCGTDYDKSVIAIKAHSYKLVTPDFKDESVEAGTIFRLKMVCGNEGCDEEHFSVPVGIKLTPEQNKLAFKLAVVLIALIIVIWAWRTIKAVPTTTSWFRRRRR